MKVARYSITVQVEPGRYYLGDPSAAIPEDRWDEFVRSWDLGHLITMDGLDCLVFNLGDSLYVAEDRSQYVVESGLIGLVPHELATNPHAPENGSFLEFTAPFECEYERQSDTVTKLRFGHISIIL